jgi:hypothetical protein
MLCERFEVGDLVIQYTERCVQHSGNVSIKSAVVGGRFGLVTRISVGGEPYILWCDNEEGFGDHWIHANLEKA